jgi:DNA-binding CsgD family transcriptional regulator
MVECLHHIAAGRTAEGTAEALGVSPHTVVAHLRKARTRLGVPSTAAAVAWLIRATEVGVP